MPITFGDVAGQEPSTVSFRVETAVINRNGTNVNREILVFGDPESSLGVGRVLAADPASTEYGVVVRQVGYSTIATVSTGSVRVHQSTAADLNVTVAGYSTIATISTGSVRVHQSTAADLNVTVAGYSTIATVSTGSVRVHQSTAADLNVTVAGYSTVVSVSTGSVRVHQSSAADLNVTVAAPWDSTYASGAKSSSGDLTIFSSVAATGWAVFGLTLTMDSTTPTLVRLLNGSTSEMGRWAFRAPSSVSIGANVAVAMPAYIYRSASANAVVLNTDSTATIHYALQAYRI